MLEWRKEGREERISREKGNGGERERDDGRFLKAVY